MICHILVSEAGIEEGLERRMTVSHALKMQAGESGSLVVHAIGDTKGVILAPGTWIKASLEAEAK